jgi:hypothetical protein
MSCDRTEGMKILLPYHLPPTTYFQIGVDEIGAQFSGKKEIFLNFSKGSDKSKKFGYDSGCVRSEPARGPRRNTASRRSSF